MTERDERSLSSCGPPLSGRQACLLADENWRAGRTRRRARTLFGGETQARKRTHKWSAFAICCVHVCPSPASHTRAPLRERTLSEHNGELPQQIRRPARDDDRNESAARASRRARPNSIWPQQQIQFGPAAAFHIHWRRQNGPRGRFAQAARNKTQQQSRKFNYNNELNPRNWLRSSCLHNESRRHYWRRRPGASAQLAPGRARRDEPAGAASGAISRMPFGRPAGRRQSAPVSRPRRRRVTNGRRQVSLTAGGRAAASVELGVSLNGRPLSAARERDKRVPRRRWLFEGSKS
jgi:hypothetical protein